MHVPMLAGDRIIGVISVQSYQEDAYGQEDLQMLEVIANQAAISVENARLYDSVQDELNERGLAEDQLYQRNRELTLLNQMSQALSSTLDIDRVLITLLNEVDKLLNIASSSVWLVDPATNELVCCHAVGFQSEAVLGWRLASGQGISGWVVSHGESLIVPDAQADGRHFDGVDRTSGLLVRSMLSVPLRTREQVIGVLNVVDTATGRFKQSDQTLLELLAASAAIAIDNARLIEALRQHATELEVRNEELDAFAHTVAHDLTNPLANIVGHAETLELHHKMMQDQDREYCLQAVSRSARKMSNIIDELLLLAGVRKTEAKRVPLDMSSIVTESMSRLADLIDKSNAEIIVLEICSWPKAMGYAPWVEEVWVNYLSNAIKYGGKPPQVELGATLFSTPHASGGEVRENIVCFWVRDNGDGLTPDDQARLFTPFTRLDQIRAKGHGLGLSIVRRIVEKLGGQVGVQSTGEPGQGSTFFFTLPAASNGDTSDLSKRGSINEQDCPAKN
jgi:K+-sensing histidine kinase KdpD